MNSRDRVLRVMVNELEENLIVELARVKGRNKSEMTRECIREIAQLNGIDLPDAKVFPIKK